jgi:D-alanyl-D-alanine carboxypeptidase
LLAWDAALTSGAVVPAGDYTAMTSAQTPPGAKVPYGFAFIVDQHDAQPRIWHNGGTFGFNASDQYFPNQHTRIVVLTNDAEGNADGLVGRVFDDLYPELAAAAAKPSAGEDPAYTARVKGVFQSLLAGKIDRSQFDAPANAALTDALISQASAQFAALGKPQGYAFKGCTAAAAGKVCKYSVTFPAATMILTVGNDPDGKFNTIFLGPQ